MMNAIFFDFAVRNIKIHWLRTLLAVIGIVIGVGAIATMGMLGNCLSVSVSAQLSDVGDSIVVYPIGSVDSKLTERQVKDIRSASGSSFVIPVLNEYDDIEVGKEKGSVSVYALEENDLPRMFELENGQWIKSTSTAVVGYKTAKDYDLVIGSRINVGGNTLRVVGILKERGMSFDISPDSAVFVSPKYYKAEYDTSDYNQVIVKVDDVSQIDIIKNSIERKLNKREDIVSVFDTKAILDAIVTTFDQITVFTTAIGGISLIVAGVSIFNIQMMSVTERIREIGIIRSLGAQKMEVLKMFLYEALILGLFGALIGAVLSFLGGAAVTGLLFQDISLLFYPTTLMFVPFGMSFGVATSLISGIYPAWKASNLSPIEALRHE